MNTRFRLNSGWIRLVSKFGFMASDEQDAGGNRPAENTDEPIVCDMRRAWAMLKMFEDGGVRFPRQICDSLKRAAVAHDERMWSPCVYRDFRDALALLDSMMSRRDGDITQIAGCGDEGNSVGPRVSSARARLMRAVSLLVANSRRLNQMRRMRQASRAD